MIQREVSRVLVLNLSGKNKRCLRTAQDNYALDRAFALIEGHPLRPWPIRHLVRLHPSHRFGFGLDWRLFGYAFSADQRQVVSGVEWVAVSGLLSGGTQGDVHAAIVG